MFGRTIRCHYLPGIIVALVLISALLVQSGCGGGSSQNSSRAPTPQILLTASSPSRLPISLVDSAGTTVDLISSSMPVEMMQLLGTMQPLVVMTIPQGTYTKASMAIGSATVT